LGTLFGVGVGPGDPGLLTVRAIEIIQQAPTVAYPVHKRGAGSRALETVKSYLLEKTRLLPLLMPMTRDQTRLEQAHVEAAQAIVKAASAGDDVAYLSLGDPLFYSTFGYLAQRFPGSIEVVSGVTAASATAAALGLPMADGDTPTVVVSGNAHEALAAALRLGGSVIVIKPRSLAPESLDLLDRVGAWKRARAAIELGGSGERLIHDLDRAAAESLPYFAVLWIQPERTSNPGEELG